MTRKPAFAHSAHFHKHEKSLDVIYCLHKWTNVIGYYA